MKRYGLIIGISLILAAILGWVSARGEDSSNREIRDPWPDALGAADTMSINDALARLNASALFPKPEADRNEKGQLIGPDGKPIDGSASGDDAAPPFPDIRGVSILDGRAHVTLELPGGAIETIAEGETLSSGWQLKSVDAARIIATYDTEEITRPIRDYAPGG